MISDQCSKFLSFSSHQFGSMKGFIRLSHFKTLLYLGVFLGLVIVASTDTGIIIPTASGADPGGWMGPVASHPLHQFYYAT